MNEKDRAALARELQAARDAIYNAHFWLMNTSDITAVAGELDGAGAAISRARAAMLTPAQ
ncbi:hypothetical protein [Frankia sp. Cj3]|uniref:hypothetical protein n=1 Tax=Frankia sp. Cj3 TaxID=2880976 RepID=UPI001EF73885|nr:hypothetical protein [Frankia sp. Cj3]